MKKKALVALASLLVITLLAGCGGVSQDVYDTAIKEASELKAQLSSMQANLTKSTADLATAQQNLTTVIDDRDSIIKQLDKAKADLTTAQANLATAQQSLSTLNTSVKTYQPYVDISMVFVEYENLVDMGYDWNSTAIQAVISKAHSVIDATQDSALISAWDTDDNLFFQLLLQQLTELKPKTQ